MHRKRHQPSRNRVWRQLRDSWRRWLASTPRRALDAWALQIETELAARPWPWREGCYSPDCLYCEGNRTDVSLSWGAA